MPTRACLTTSALHCYILGAMQKSLTQTYDPVWLSGLDEDHCLLNIMSSLSLKMQLYFLFSSLGELRQKRVYKKKTGLEKKDCDEMTACGK